jgi:hypothetical protein
LCLAVIKICLALNGHSTKDASTSKCFRDLSGMNREVPWSSRH